MAHKPTITKIINIEKLLDKFCVYKTYKIDTNLDNSVKFSDKKQSILH